MGSLLNITLLAVVCFPIQCVFFACSAHICIEVQIYLHDVTFVYALSMPITEENALKSCLVRGQ